MNTRKPTALSSSLLQNDREIMLIKQGVQASEQLDPFKLKEVRMRSKHLVSTPSLTKPSTILNNAAALFSMAPLMAKAKAIS